MSCRRLLPVCFLLVLVSVAVAAQTAPPTDSDRDGLSDQLEQSLIEQFRPTFMISAQDCDLAPAEFTPAVTRPTVLHRNGTIYAQAFRSPRSTTQTDVIELHYYHLWGSDCGRLGHPLDSEHVSALVERRSLAPASEPWRATHWYAAAHQETVCDNSSGARASVLDAEQHGPTIWISSGKHASFFSQEECSLGCGGDRCRNMKEMAVASVVNLGELDAPMNQALWTASPQWPLSQRMRSDFDDRVVAAIDSHPESIARVAGLQSAQSVILGGNAAIDGVAVGQQETGNALFVAGKHTWRSLKTSFRSVKKALTPASDPPKTK